MKVLVIGGGGKTGKLVVEKAMRAGHKVTVLLHAAKDGNPPELPVGVEAFHGDVRNPSKLEQAMAGQEAVIDALGGKKPFLETDLESSAAKVVIEVMQRVGVKRLIVVSALGEGESKEQTTWAYEHLLMPLFLRGIIPDKAKMEEAVMASGLEFTIVRPPVLNDSDETGQVHVLAAGETAHKITRADLAQFLVDQLASSAHVGTAVTIANS